MSENSTSLSVSIPKKSSRDNNRPPKKTKNESESSLSSSTASRPTTPKHQSQWNKTTPSDSPSDDDDSELCIVCADKIYIASISPCNHKVCHFCSFKQRALYDKKQCLVCRTENDRLLFTEDTNIEEYKAVTTSQIVTTDERYGIDFTSYSARDDTLKLLEYLCPSKSCKEKPFPSFKKLNEHCKEKHDKSFCSLCANYKKTFISLLKLYTPRQLQTHQSRGDEDGFTGHPICKFCSGKRFYSDDELFVHLRERHEKCHVCEQIDSSKSQYFKNYDQLFSHFRDIHYVCNVQTCLDQKFVVFADDLDLKAHLIKEHGNIFGSDKTLISSSSGFGAQLTTFRNGNNRRGGGGSQRQFEGEDEPQDSYETKKKRLDERARHYLNYSQPDFESFQAVNIAYSNDDLIAPQLFKKYREIFKRVPESDLNLLIYDLSELFPPKSLKQRELLKLTEKETKQATLDEQFPALAGSSNSSGSALTGWGKSVAVKSSKKLTTSNNFPALQRSTTPSTSIPINASSVPGFVTLKKPTPRPQYSAVSSSSTPTPPLRYTTSASSSSTSSMSSKLNTKTVIRSSSPAQNNNFKPTYLSSTALNSNKPKKEAAIDTEAFPELPTFQRKPKPPRVNPVNVTLGQWGSGSGSGSGSSTPLTNGNDDAFDMTLLSSQLSSNVKGKKKKGKQILFQLG